jgi:hypothetical protein
VARRPGSVSFLLTSLAAIEDRPACENKPAHDGHARQDGGNRVTEQCGGPYGTSEGREIRHDVVDGGDESLIHDMGGSYEDAASEGHGQEDANHREQFGPNPQHNQPRRSCPVRADRPRSTIAAERALWASR